MKLKQGVTTIFCSLLITANAQILTVESELYRDTTSGKKIGATLSLAFSNSKQRKNLLDFSSRGEFDVYFKNRYALIFLGRTDATYNGKTVLQNNGYLQIRYRDQDSRKFSLEPSLQAQWNGIQGMEYRFLTSLNLRMRWLTRPKANLYTGLGTFYEMERWNPLLGGYAFAMGDSSIILRNMFRLNLTSKYTLQLGTFVTWTGMTYVQFPINQHFNTPRWVFDTQFLFKLNKHLSFTINYNHNLDFFRPLPIDPYFYATSSGIRISI
ncbi:MAG: hypothetical protein RIQ90_804 [Bacteroidota bacterium]